MFYLPDETRLCMVVPSGIAPNNLIKMGGEDGGPGEEREMRGAQMIRASLGLATALLALALLARALSSASATSSPSGISVGAIWTLSGQFSEQGTGSAYYSTLYTTDEGAVLNLTIIGPMFWTWEEGKGRAVDVRIALVEIENPELEGVRIDELTCYLYFFDYYHDEWVEVASSDTRSVGADLAEGPAVVQDLEIRFTTGFPWEIMEEWIYPLKAQACLNVSYTAFFVGGEGVGGEFGELTDFTVECTPPGFASRTYTLTFNITELDGETGEARANTTYVFNVGGVERRSSSILLFNARELIHPEMLDYLFEFWFLAFTHGPLAPNPLVLTDDWSSLGDKWEEDISSLASAHDADMEASFGFERAILAGREVDLAVFSLTYNADVKEASMEGQVKGPYNLKWKFDAETGALMAVEWEEGLDIKYSYGALTAGGGIMSIYRSSSHRAISIAMTIAHASFKFGRPIARPVLEPTPLAAAAIASGAATGAIGAGISAVAAGISAPPTSAAAAPTALAPPTEKMKPSFFSKILSGIRYLLGKRKKKYIYEPPKNTLTFLLCTIIIAAASATVPFVMVGAPLEPASIPTSIYLSAIGFALACTSLSLFTRRTLFYKEYGLRVDKREKAFLGLSLALGLWGVISSPLGLFSMLVAHLASIAIGVPAVAVVLHAIADIRSWP